MAGNETKIDVHKAFGAVAKILSARENVDIKVISVRRKQTKDGGNKQSET